MKLILNESAKLIFGESIAYLGDYIEIKEGGADVRLNLTDGNTVTVERHDGVITISASRAHLYRALGTAIKNASKQDYKVVESAVFPSLTFMLDCSRNAVITVEAFQKLAVRLALLGYNGIDLYIEDVISLDGEPYFGHMRGRFSVDELRKMDELAHLFSMELTPSVQTLAHYDNIFLWPAYAGVKDLANILLIGEERTYALLDKLFATLATAFTSRRINIGFDEAHLVCFGAYVHKNGVPKNRTKIVLEHLKRVLEIAKKYGFSPSMWSDMFFRLAYKGAYYPGYSESNRALRTAKGLVPEGVELIYWDYYHTNRADYDKMFSRHRVLGRPVRFAGGAWKWLGYAPHNAYGISCLLPALASAKRNKATGFMLTAWGDDGAEAPLYTVIPQIVTVAEFAYRGRHSLTAVRTACRALLNASYDDFMMLDLPNRTGFNEEEGAPYNPGKYLLYNDPLAGLFDAHIGADYADYYAKATTALGDAKRRNPAYDTTFALIEKLCGYLSKKIDLSTRMRSAYQSNDKAALGSLRDHAVPNAICALDEFINALRAVWMADNKAFGLDNLQIRLGGQRQRLAEVGVRLNQYLTGEINTIEELDTPVLPFDPTAPDTDIFRDVYSTMATSSYYLTRT